MIINVFFEDEDIADIISIPDSLKDVSLLQEKFFQWLFNKNIEHDYWVTINGEKIYCSYGTKAFVDWLNENILECDNRKAQIIESNSKDFSKDDYALYF